MTFAVDHHDRVAALGRHGLLGRHGFDAALLCGALLCGALLLSASGGCDPSVSGVLSSEAEQASKAAAPRESESIGVREFWEVYRGDGQSAGYGSTTITPLSEGGRQLVQYTREDRLSVRREGQTLTHDWTFTSVETLEGQIVRFESKVSLGPTPILTQGRYEDGHLHIETTTKGKTQTRRLPWPADSGGFFSLEQSLARRPMKPGEKRTIRALSPVFVQPIDIHLEAIDLEPTQLLDGKRRLLRIEITHVLAAGNRMRFILWADDAGIVLKSRQIGLPMEAFRVSKEVALAESDAEPFDLGQYSTVKVDRPLRMPHQTRRVVYRVRVQGGDPSDIFVSGPGQTVKPIDEHTAEITVRAIRPDQPEQVDSDGQTRPTDDDLVANNLIQSDDERVVAMAQSVVPGERDPWQIAIALERYVKKTIEVKDFSTAFATAAEVAQSRTGDCTEHAVLLAALCRARQIHARVAIGLVYYRPKRGYVNGFAYHMWTEVWIDDRWIAIDGTLGLGGIGGAHLTVAQSNLNGNDILSAFLPVTELMGRLDLRIVEVR